MLFRSHGVKAKSEAEVSAQNSIRADIVRERNGLVKIYVDGILSGGGYKDGAMPTVTDSEMRMHDAVSECTLYDTALPFDKLK